MRIGVDVGAVRIGVAACDPDGVLASPVTVLRRDSAGPAPAEAGPAAQSAGTGAAGVAEIAEIAEIAAERAAIEVLVGCPRSLSGRRGPAESVARRYAAVLAAGVAPIPVRLVDERFSTVTASRRMRAAGRSARQQRPVVDAAAAAVLVQAALDEERSTGHPPGELVASPARGRLETGDGDG